MTTAPTADLVMERLLNEAAREFPGWAFERDQAGWTAVNGDLRLTRHSLAALRALLRVHRAAGRR
ncbi:hypothetical protein MF672_047410 [Actinomadura sp. ATCC 31491]|uniref:Uncharacterized protein n=1 Tax=Actinomadura luzonensis TaxID=2805427 RepID=A0ABT0GBB2_9ACTN|nr:hypothetical protein [Actinomadura luzonensis]MCK2221383.1 hypothetical protein [Actinomadura luzonensis]